MRLVEEMVVEEGEETMGAILLKLLVVIPFFDVFLFVYRSVANRVSDDGRHRRSLDFYTWKSASQIGVLVICGMKSRVHLTMNLQLRWHSLPGWRKYRGC